jgi:hypothetical protein
VDETELTVTAQDRELTITYQGRTFVLLAYPLEDLGIWDAVAHEQGESIPAMPAVEWGVADTFRDPWSALSTLTEAIIRQTDARRGADPHGRADFKDPPSD